MNRRNRSRTANLTNQQVLIVKNPGAIVPDRLITTLNYIDVNHSSIGNPATVYGSYRYRPTSVYDIDPSIGGTTVAGFAELAAFYNYYRVHSSSIKVHFVNQDTATAPLIIVLPLNNDPGSGPSAATIQSWQMNPYSHFKLLSAKGGMDRGVVFNHITTEKFVGSRAVRFDDSYASAVTTIPSNNWFWGVGVLSEGGVNFTNGLTFQVLLSVRVEFYDRKELTS